MLDLTISENGVLSKVRAKKLTSIEIPDSVKIIEKAVFSVFSILKEVTIPDSVVSIGDSAFAGCKSLTQITVDENNKNFTSVDGILYSKDKTQLLCYPAGKTETSFEIPDSVTKIGNWAFRLCKNLESITIPDSVTAIGDNAFNGCEFTSITIPNSVTYIGDLAFSSCYGLTSLDIPDSVTKIGNWAFAYCENLNSVTIEDGVQNIGEEAFKDCTALKSIAIPASVTSVGNKVFKGCTKLGKVTLLGDSNPYGEVFGDLTVAWNGGKSVAAKNSEYKYRYVKQNNTAIITEYKEKYNTWLDIPTEIDGYTVTRIGDFAFYNCYLESVTIPDTVTSIGERAFESCNFKNITIPDSVTSIGDGAFYFCGDLTRITIPSSVMSIGNGAFSCCYNLTKVNIENNATKIGDGVFESCEKLRKVTIIGDSNPYGDVFEDATVTWNGGVSDIGTIPDYDFRYNTQNKTATIKKYRGSASTLTIDTIDGYTVTSIGKRAFADCKDLTSVTIGNSVTSIGNGAFYGCNSLKTVYIKGESNPYGDIFGNAEIKIIG